MKILDTKVFKSDGNVVHFAHLWEDKCWVHYSTTGKIADAQVTWGSNSSCGHKDHKKPRMLNKG